METALIVAICSLLSSLLTGQLMAQRQKRRYEKEDQKRQDDSAIRTAEIVDRQKLTDELWTINRRLLDAEAAFINERIELHRARDVAERRAERVEWEKAEIARDLEEQREENLSLTRQLKTAESERDLAIDDRNGYIRELNKLKTQYPYNLNQDKGDG